MVKVELNEKELYIIDKLLYDNNDINKFKDNKFNKETYLKLYEKIDKLYRTCDQING